MAAYPELFILRHGETEWNAEGRLQGALNSPLTDLGKQQAARQGDILAAYDLRGFDIISSPQGRAFETAAIALARQVGHVHTDARLCEIGMGEWAGHLRCDIADGRFVFDGPDGALELYEHAPDGEGFAALALRCHEFLAGLTRPCVLVTHGITSRMIRAIATGVGRVGIADIGGGQGVVYHIEKGVQKRLD